MKNILILTVDCWNLNNAANSSYTFSNLFTAMDDYNISNIYIRDELPNDPCCSRYFQISENRIIKHLFNRKVKTGKEVECGVASTKEDIIVVQQQKELYEKQRRSLYYTKKFLRELIWKLSSFKSRELDSFLDSVNPDVVIFSMEGYIHFNRLCRYVIKKTTAKGIGYFWDDNFTYKQRPNNFGYKAFRFFQRKSLKCLVKKTDSFWAISEKTKKEADEFFGIDCIVLAKPAEREVPLLVERKSYCFPIRMMYAGNLMIGRMDTIKAVIEELININRERIKIRLDIYSATEIPVELSKIGHGVTFHKPVSQSDILKLQQQADILLFVEDIIGENRKVSRLSFSTKIPDYLSSGKCILAIGDSDTAPMEYFLRTSSAICITRKDEIEVTLRKIITNPDIILICMHNACKCVQENHNVNKIRNIVKKTINDL